MHSEDRRSSNLGFAGEQAGDVETVSLFQARDRQCEQRQKNERALEKRDKKSEDDSMSDEKRETRDKKKDKQERPEKERAGNNYLTILFFAKPCQIWEIVD